MNPVADQPSPSNETIVVNVKSWRDNLGAAGVVVTMVAVAVGVIGNYYHIETSTGQNATDLKEYKQSTTEQFKAIRSDLNQTNLRIDKISSDVGDIKQAVGRIEGAVGSK
jgi:hypothetical protein